MLPSGYIKISLVCPNKVNKYKKSEKKNNSILLSKLIRSSLNLTYGFRLETFHLMRRLTPLFTLVDQNQSNADLRLVLLFHISDYSPFWLINSNQQCSRKTGKWI